MRVSLPRPWRFLALPLLVLAPAIPWGRLRGQNQQVPPAVSRQPSPGINNGANNQLPEPAGVDTTSKLEHMREDERHKRLLADTARLLALTNELRDEVDKSSRDELSLDVIRKATEIEKLARDVRERMKN